MLTMIFFHYFSLSQTEGPRKINLVDSGSLKDLRTGFQHQREAHTISEAHGYAATFTQGV